MNTENLRRYVHLKDQISKVDTDLSELKKQAGELEQELLDELSDDGINKITVDGRTVYMRRELWARKEQGVEGYEVAQAVMKAGLDEYVQPKVNMQSLSAFVRDLDRAEEPLPYELEGVVRVDEVFRLGVRSS